MVLLLSLSLVKNDEEIVAQYLSQVVHLQLFNEMPGESIPQFTVVQWHSVLFHLCSPVTLEQSSYSNKVAAKITMFYLPFTRKNNLIDWPIDIGAGLGAQHHFFGVE